LYCCCVPAIVKIERYHEPGVVHWRLRFALIQTKSVRVMKAMSLFSNPGVRTFTAVSYCQSPASFANRL
jgi:hypothetical protein